MAYGLQTTSLALDSGVPQFSGAHRPAVRRWRALSPDRRLALIEQSLAGTGVNDGLPLAL